jgi:uncharacterized protein
MPAYPFRTALVTGASAGIGEAIVRRLAADGVKTIVVARRADRLEALAKELPGVEVLVGDVADLADIDRIAARVAEVDLLVNNAGLGVHCKAAAAPPHHFDNQVAVNIGAVVELSRAAAVAMSARRRGWILNVSSVAGGISTPENAVYGASKAFVTNFSDALGLELKSSGVKVTALLPGYTHTEFHEVSGSSADDQGAPTWMWQSADEVASTALADAAAGRTRSIPGAHNKVAVGLTRYLPRVVVNAVVSRTL